MKLPLRALAGKSSRAGVAAMEFALVTPVLVWLFIGVADFSMAYHDQLEVSSALSAGAEYAFTQGQTTSQTVQTLDTNVQNFVTNVIGLNLKGASSTVSVAYNNGLTSTSSTLSSASCYCVSGSPATYTASASCGAACGDGSTSGTWVSITGSFTYTPMFAGDSIFFPSALSQTIVVRLK
jgi:Flp pilus assembly protein TadG